MASGDAATRDIERVGVEAARREAQTGRALLVCAYDDAKCARVPLEGAITVGELSRRAGSLPKNQAIIFYCA